MNDKVLIVIAVVAVVGLIIGVIFFLAARRKAEDNKPQAPAPPPRAGSGQRFNWLVGASGSVEGKTFHVGERTVSIGRLVGSFVQIAEDEQVSRAHCQLRPQGRALVIKDTDSNTGTFVNDERISGDHVLQDGDRIRVGGSELIYHREGSFAVDHGLGRKDASTRAVKPTIAGGQKSLQSMAFEALEQFQGDRIKAADSLGLSLEAFERVLSDKNKG